MRGPYGKLWTEFFSFLLWPKREARGPWKQGRKKWGSITCCMDRANEANKMFTIWLCQLFLFWKGDRELAVRTATYGPGIDRSQHAKSVSHIINILYFFWFWTCKLKYSGENDHKSRKYLISGKRGSRCWYWPYLLQELQFPQIWLFRSTLYFSLIWRHNHLSECSKTKCCYWTPVIRHINKPILTWVPFFLTNQQQDKGLELWLAAANLWETVA